MSITRTHKCSLNSIEFYSMIGMELNSVRSILMCTMQKSNFFFAMSTDSIGIIFLIFVTWTEVQRFIILVFPI